MMPLVMIVAEIAFLGHCRIKPKPGKHNTQRHDGPHDSEEPNMQAVTTIGLDIAKSVFQIHGVDAAGNVIVRRQLKRRYVLPFFQKLPPCLVGIEACASSHHWSRELQAFGHTVRLMPPAYVKPYVKRHKNDAADAEAICEAVTRANMRFVATKTVEQQSCLMLHRTRYHDKLDNRELDLEHDGFEYRVIGSAHRRLDGQPGD